MFIRAVSLRGAQENLYTVMDLYTRTGTKDKPSVLGIGKNQGWAH
jgi:hypothetical protein